MKTKTPSKNIVFNHDRREVFVNGKEVHFPPSEYGVLKALIETNKVLNREELLKFLGRSPDQIKRQSSDHRAIDQYVARLRRRLGPGYVTTVSNAGYRYDGHK